MSVLVQFTVKVSDVDRFVTTSEKFAPMMQEMGVAKAASTRTRSTPVWSLPSRSGTATTRCTPLRRSTAISSTRRRGPPGSTGRPTSGTGRGTPDPSESIENACSQSRTVLSPKHAF